MSHVLKSDFYRLRKLRIFYMIIVLTSVIALSISMLLHKDIRLGISMMGELTSFKNMDHLVLMGAEYNKVLGIFIAILISTYIGQEYQWKTWQHKLITNESRSLIYLAKVIVSSLVSVFIFLLYEVVVLLSSGNPLELLTRYSGMILCSIFLYAAFGAVICLFSMLIHNSKGAVIVCLLYVLFFDSLISLVINVGRIFHVPSAFIESGIRHTIYGMSTTILGDPYQLIILYLY